MATMYTLTHFIHKIVDFTVKTSCGKRGKSFLLRGGRVILLTWCDKCGKPLPQIVSVEITGNNVHAYPF